MCIGKSVIEHQKVSRSKFCLHCGSLFFGGRPPYSVQHQCSSPRRAVLSVESVPSEHSSHHCGESTIDIAKVATDKMDVEAT